MVGYPAAAVKRDHVDRAGPGPALAALPLARVPRAGGELIATLRRSLAEQANEELRRAAHTLKSNGATLGAESFSELCRTLEHSAKTGALEDAGELIDAIEQEYRPLEEALTALRTGTPS